MPCPECKSVCLTAISNHVEYIDEPYSFNEKEVIHGHDFNPRVTVWGCNNGHTFQLRGIKICIGCIIERQLTVQAPQPNRQRNYNNDHHPTGLSDFFNPGTL